MVDFKKYYYLSIALFVFSFNSKAQNDSLVGYVESMTAFASKDYLPFWAVNNQEGRFTDRAFDAWFESGAIGWLSLDSNFSIDYKVSAVLKSPINQSFLKSYNVSLNWKAFKLKGGRFYNVNDEPASKLRSGSFTQSRNAIPLPRVGIEVDQYSPVPFTQNWLYFKGSLYHGWFEKERALSNAWLHEKSAYLRLGKPQGLRVSWGLVHLAMWGGTDEYGTKWTRGFTQDYYTIFTGSGAAESDNPGSAVRLEGSNRQGNHLGIWDIRLNYTYRNHEIELYYHRLWEDRWSLNKIFNRDAKWGLAWEKKGHKTSLLSSVVVEFMHTKLQRGAGIPDSVPGQSNYGYEYGGRDDYYNNWLYRSGWTYQDRVIGSPLFITEERAEKYFGSINNYRVKIVNNRFWALHLGVESRPLENWSFRGKFTFSRNFGTYAGLNGGRFKWGSLEPGFDNSDYPFIEPLDQVNSIIEATYLTRNKQGLEISVGFAADFGEMSENYGGLMGVKCYFR